ncbi:MAG: hypothetical protein FWF28_00830 [Micrococcales bacterium]|nr:hypothetical protein [Micrococcales bacterium]
MIEMIDGDELEALLDRHCPVMRRAYHGASLVGCSCDTSLYLATWHDMVAHLADVLLPMICREQAAAVRDAAAQIVQRQPRAHGKGGDEARLEWIVMAQLLHVLADQMDESGREDHESELPSGPVPDLEAAGDAPNEGGAPDRLHLRPENGQEASVDLATIRSLHQWKRGKRNRWCCECRQAWPCDAIRLCDEVDQLRDALAQSQGCDEALDALTRRAEKAEAVVAAVRRVFRQHSVPAFIPQDGVLGPRVWCVPVIDVHQALGDGRVVTS